MDTLVRPRSTRTLWRKNDPPATKVGELSPEDLGGRIVIRAASQTLYGTLVGVQPHPSLSGFSLVQLKGKPVALLRDDFEAIVVDDLRPGPGRV